MEFIYGKSDWKNMEQGQENCWLMANGLGGFSSLTVLGSMTRNDHALLMASAKAPTERVHMVSRLGEALVRRGDCTVLSTQQFVNHTLNEEGFRYLDAFRMGVWPQWTFRTGGIEVKKELTMIHGKNAAAVRYSICSREREDAELVVTPWFQFVEKGAELLGEPEFVTDSQSVTGNGRTLYYETNGRVVLLPVTFQRDLYYPRDAADGGMSVGAAVKTHEIHFEIPAGRKTECLLIYHMERPEAFEAGLRAAEALKIYMEPNGIYPAGEEPADRGSSGDGEEPADRGSSGAGEETVDKGSSGDGLTTAVTGEREAGLAVAETGKACPGTGEAEAAEAGWNLTGMAESIFRLQRRRAESLEARAGLKDDLAGVFVRSADQYLVDRESTGGKSIIAGYPFFGDWGRDTMIAMTGLCITTRRFEEARNIFRTFIKYLRRGIMPNMFPEDGQEPLYNTVDASLQFVAALREYHRASGDLDFVEEAWPAVVEILEYYRKGTDFCIHMEEDGLISAGSGFDQVTWMDVRIGDILPTPRHGKPVEVNACWYHALRTAREFALLLGKEGGADYGALAGRVKQSFREKFWNPEEGCLYDTRSGELPTASDRQVRCNQIWAVSIPEDLLEPEQQRQVVDKVFAELYTPCGLRSLSPKDPQFHPCYGGSQYRRDLAYHQGTVWGFPLGGFYLAWLKVNGAAASAKAQVREWLEELVPFLREGCIGHIAEIYDGETPCVSQGCFAQAWSVGEILRVFGELE